MITKNSNERFVFLNGGYQDFPNHTNDESATVVLIDDYVPPQKSNDELFAEEIDALNDKHYQDVIDATNSYNIAKARDGSTETEKVIAARAKLADIDAQYEVDQLAIINKYYGA